MDDAGAKVVDLIFGRWRSQILYTGVKLGVFDALRIGIPKGLFVWPHAAASGHARPTALAVFPVRQQPA